MNKCILKKVINKKVVTDATPLEDPKDAEGSIVCQLHQLVASTDASAKLKSKLEAGGYGWGHAKNDLLRAIISKFEKERALFDELMAKPDVVEEKLQEGAKKAQAVAREVLGRIRAKVGY